MTERQKQRIASVQAYLSQVHAAASAAMDGRPDGFTIIVRVPCEAVLEVRKTPNGKRPAGLEFRVVDDRRKGWTEPKWRRLLAAAPTDLQRDAVS
jgi:hypothetical protein